MKTLACTDTSNPDLNRCDQPPQGQTSVHIFSDGSCIGNPGPGGWGAVILWRDCHSGEILRRDERYGPAKDLTTNVRMEMTAVCCALESLGVPTADSVTVYCDANLIPNAMNTWLAKWKSKAWRKSDGKPVENRDLWERIEQAATARNITWAWVRGHNGCEHNERADRLAYSASRMAENAGIGR